MGWHQEFRKLMVELVHIFQFPTYVEIGARNGDTFNLIAPLVKRAVAVDIIPMDGVIKRPNVEVFHMTSQDFANTWTDPINLLFIDADHSAKVVMQDFNRLSQFVPEGTGLILLHDTHPISKEQLAPTRCGDAWKAAWMIRSDPAFQHFEIVTLPGPIAGLSIIRKAIKHLAWKSDGVA